jgi:glucosylceramidase
MKKFALFLLLGAISATAAQPNVRWISSTEAAPWQTLQPSAPAPGAPVIELDPATRYQVIDGFGGCFNDLGWQALLALQPPAREAALKLLFDPAAANFTLGRMPIGANDFSLKWYSFDETPGDFAMRDFSIARDKEDLIPYIKAAMQYQPGLGVWGVPWSPPAWMKTNDRYKGGAINFDPRILAAYALYFSKYVQAYRAAGVRVYAVMPQNEAIYTDGIYPQCGWTALQLDGFLRDYLVPRLRKDGVKVQVWLGTMDSGKVSEYIDPVLGDPVTGPEITGVGCQYGGQATMADTHREYPDKKIAQTETECYNGENSWDEALTTFQRILEDTDHFAGSYFYWNLILNESGRSTWNWRQNSLLTIDRKKDSVIVNPEYYSMKHFSANVLPGARRIAVSGGPFKNTVAFVNPAGSEEVLFENSSANPVTVSLDTGGTVVSLKVPERSMNTVTIGGE